MPPKASQRPGYRTSEYWITVLVTVAGLVLASGAIVEGSVWFKIASLVVSLGATVGYTASRTGLKKTLTMLLVVCTLATFLVLPGCTWLKALGMGTAEAVDSALGTAHPENGTVADWLLWLITAGGLTGWALYGKEKFKQAGGGSE